ncbi:MAG: YqgE/AlgH family protein [Gemmatimonadetes bacterium]|nr:YqgE/AlgH family protein [Gemmatimonadota bacterium]
MGAPAWPGNARRVGSVPRSGVGNFRRIAGPRAPLAATSSSATFPSHDALDGAQAVKSLRGQLLISSGGLFDPNFRHTVVLIGEHNAEGALGVVLNRPLDVTVADAIPPLASLVDPGERLYQGGPVQPTSPVLLGHFSDPARADLPVFGAVGFLIGEVEAAVADALERARVFAGYAGWGPGQLEQELAEDSWLVEAALAEDVFTEDPDRLWHRVLQRKGPDFRHAAEIPFDPRTN